MTSLPSRKGARAALVLVVALVSVGLAERGKVWLEHRAEVQKIEGLRTRLAELRSGVGACRAAVEREQSAFDRYRASVESLREEVREYEMLDERGVPADQYDAYLETFDQYNESLPGWQARADSLQAHDDVCRDLTVRHNETADSLRESLEGAARR
jgi:hypothetical protein